VALAWRERAAAMASSQQHLSARSGFRRQGRAHSRSLSSALGRCPPWTARLCAEHRREDQHSGAPAQTSHTAPASGRSIYLEHEHKRCGAWAYIAALDGHRSKLFGRCERKTGIVPFQRLVAQVMRQELYRSARRVFWIVDNGSSHSDSPAIARLNTKWPNLVLIHTPAHASWLNQTETFFSVVQLKVVTPNDFPDRAAGKQRLLSFQQPYQASAKPFRRTFTRRDLHPMLAKFTNPYTTSPPNSQPHNTSL
jgi:DDE superfamily endonuclease